MSFIASGRFSAQRREDSRRVSVDEMANGRLAQLTDVVPRTGGEPAA
jgi:hypothetical protein